MKKNDYQKVIELINDADAIVIGAGMELSNDAGVEYGKKNFIKNFKELNTEYGFEDMYLSSFFQFETEEEKWSYWSKHINYICTGKEVTETYKELYDLLHDKNYFIVTTNVDDQFEKAGFDVKKVFEIDGSLEDIQCAHACHKKVYNDKDIVDKLINYKKETKVPSDLIPICPECGKGMEPHIRKDNFFVEDELWDERSNAYKNFIIENNDKKILFIELGVDFSNPSIIRYPFENYTYNLEKAYLVRINNHFFNVPNDISIKSVGIKDNLKNAISTLKRLNDKMTK